MIDKKQNKEELTEKLTAICQGFNLKAEIVLKQKEDDGFEIDVLNKELIQSDQLRVDFLVVSRRGMSVQEQNHNRMGNVAEFISKRFRGNLILY